ncbi:PEP-CTERM sorting domain-containing protein [Nitrosomonas sp. Is35]|uniref:PEP-CTERM sorting domain-containing protein n=1 Tax=Nitrosomonas sp. Is35 TaxID=3080534 RepID=UPI00294AEA1C|nr:PEP-CTERM sorting domain-containing protein [Nitrosomonas sp. Is35]MDV6345978.1 PEP-CTERM sorting domain-containing protein [Nitrosomonas sp. Is35]
MKFEMKKSHVAKAVVLALCGTFAASAQALPTVISGFGTTSATIADAGYFSPAGALGLSFMGREFVNHGTFASNWSLNANSSSVAVADSVTGSNPLGTVSFPVGGSISVSTNLGSSGWNLLETVSIPTSGHVAVTIQLTNNTGADATNVQWSVGVDPDQGIPGGVGFGTTNEILGTGNASAVKATSLDGWSLTLANTTSAGAFDIAGYVDPFSCCAPIDAATIFSAGQTVGNYGFSDSSINLAFALGDIANGGKSQVIGYEYIMAVPEPETYAMLLAGLGLIGFSARRRISA